MEWHPARWSVCLPVLIFPCTISPEVLFWHRLTGVVPERAVKRLWLWHKSKLHIFTATYLTTVRKESVNYHNTAAARLACRNKFDYQNMSTCCRYCFSVLYVIAAVFASLMLIGLSALLTYRSVIGRRRGSW